MLSSVSAGNDKSQSADGAGWEAQATEAERGEAFRRTSFLFPGAPQ